MVWAAIHHYGKTLLHVVEGNLNAVRYRDEILRPIVLPQVRQHDLTFQQDGARCHTARLSMEFLHAENIDVLPWPAFSPDLSPIENLWNELDDRVRARDVMPQNRQELRQALEEEWARLPQAQVKTLIASMRRRCQAVINAGGGHTAY